MSEWKPRVVRLSPENISKHENADKLSVTTIDGFPVVFATEAFQVPGLAAYLPEDTVLPDGTVIRSKKLRGVLSVGMLMPMPSDALMFVEGDSVVELLKLTKVQEPDMELALATENEKCPFHFPEYTDIESYKKYGYQNEAVVVDGPNRLDDNSVETDFERNRKSRFDGMDVVVTEKIHGANARYVYKNGRLWVGSHHNIKKHDPKSIWWRAAKYHELETKLAAIPDVVVFGEVYGSVQNLKYGVEGVQFRAFDAFDLALGRFYDHDAFVELMDRLGIPTVPVLYKGPWTPEVDDMRNGKSALADHYREGFVIKPTEERYEKFGRLILKYVGEEYREAKGKAARKGDERVVALRKQLDSYKSLVAAAEEFVARVERGEVRSRKTYAALKAGLDEIKQAATP